MICVSIQEENFSKCMQLLKKCEFAEIRNDLCKFNKVQLTELVSKHPNIIITERYSSLPEYKSLNGNGLITAIENGVKYVDIELEYPIETFEKIKKLAKKAHCKLIVSYHNYKNTPSLQKLKKIANECLNKGADIIKIVTTANNISDASRILELYKCNKFSQGNLIAFAMGDKGKFSRYISLELGAPYTYTSFSDIDSTASGQYTRDEMSVLLQKGKITLPKINKSILEHNIDITIPCSKSIAQRAIISAILAQGETTLRNFSTCDDINAAITIAKQLGCSIKTSEDSLIIKSPGVHEIKNKIKESDTNLIINIGESGLLTRLLMPLSAYFTSNNNKQIEIIGKGSILQREMASTLDALNSGNINCTPVKNENQKHLPCIISNSKISQRIKISGETSSQIVSGYLMMLPLLNHNSTLIVSNPKSIPYINLTIKTLKLFGIKITKKTKRDSITFYIKGNQNYLPAEIFLDSDWSSSAYFLVMWAIAKSKFTTNNNILKIDKLHTNSNQADEAILEVLKDCGCNIYANKDSVSIAMNSPLNNFNFDATDSPDLFPILATLACFCKGKSCIKGIGRLLHKESNRAESIYTEFTKLGASIQIVDDYMYICNNSKTHLHGGNVHSHNDHRIAMSLTIASLFINGTITIDNIECINKSFPSFMEKLNIFFL